MRAQGPGPELDTIITIFYQVFLFHKDTHTHTVIHTCVDTVSFALMSELLEENSVLLRTNGCGWVFLYGGPLLVPEVKFCQLPFCSTLVTSLAYGERKWETIKGKRRFGYAATETEKIC